ncbi:MAG: cysteine--tRNA ligase [Pseudomonadota bacterium]
MLSIYNSLTRQKEVFTPIDPQNVRMYVCGMTVYDYCHLGHARVLVVFDAVYRHLKALGYPVTYVRNVTDIDDKIIQRANENGEEFRTLTQRFTHHMHEDCEALGVLPPDVEPLATETIAPIIEMIESLEKSGHAYKADNNDVYFSVEAYSPYGALSGNDLNELRAGERVAVDEFKRDPLDFVLWKAAKPGEPKWPSPWGDGRPGWHIECSAMSTQHLGNHFDIHGGGKDLQFPHHECEIAQSEAATGEKFVNYWMHNGFVRVDEEKMSKSLGNFFTIRDIMKEYRGEEIRLFMLSSHYRSPLNYSTAQLDNARNGLNRLYTALRDLDTSTGNINEGYRERFDNVMNDDFNTAEATAVLFELARELNLSRESGEITRVDELASTLRNLGERLGLLQDDPEEWLRGGSTALSISEEMIEQMINERTVARSNKDWAESDRIRDELKAHGVVLEDKAGATTWRRE